MGHHCKAIDQQFENDLKRYWSDRKSYKGIFAKEECRSFYVLIRGKHHGTRKTLDDAVALRNKVNEERGVI
jgi:hypothetical protein